MHKKAPSKTQQKTKKQFILAQNCEHWISMSKITACNYTSLVACIKVLGRNRRKWSCYFRVGFIHRKKDDIFTETECKRKLKKKKLLRRGIYILFCLSEGTVFFMFSISYLVLPYVTFISNTKASSGCCSLHIDLHYFYPPPLQICRIQRLEVG